MYIVYVINIHINVFVKKYLNMYVCIRCKEIEKEYIFSSFSVLLESLFIIKFMNLNYAIYAGKNINIQ